MVIKITDECGSYSVECDSVKQLYVNVLYGNSANICIGNDFVDCRGWFRDREDGDPDVGKKLFKARDINVCSTDWYPLTVVGAWEMNTTCYARLYTMFKHGKKEVYLVPMDTEVYVLENGKTVDKL